MRRTAANAGVGSGPRSGPTSCFSTAISDISPLGDFDSIDTSDTQAVGLGFHRLALWAATLPAPTRATCASPGRRPGSLIANCALSPNGGAMSIGGISIPYVAFVDFNSMPGAKRAILVLKC